MTSSSVCILRDHLENKQVFWQVNELTAHTSAKCPFDSQKNKWVSELTIYLFIFGSHFIYVYFKSNWSVRFVNDMLLWLLFRMYRFIITIINICCFQINSIYPLGLVHKENISHSDELMDHMWIFRLIYEIFSESLPNDEVTKHQCFFLPYPNFILYISWNWWLRWNKSVFTYVSITFCGQFSWSGMCALFSWERATYRLYGVWFARGDWELIRLAMRL